MTDKRVVILTDGQVTIGGVVCKLVPVEPTGEMIDAPNVFGMITIPENMPDAEAMQRTIERHRKANRDRYTAMLSAAAIDLSGLPRVPERLKSPPFGWLPDDGGEEYAQAYNAALDALGIK